MTRIDRRTGRNRSAAARALLVIVLSGTAASAQEPSRLPDHAAISGTMSGAITCESRSLMICQDEFCSVLFDRASGQSLTIDLDLDRKSYVVPPLGPDAKPMRIVATEQTPGHLALKFGIALAHDRPAAVEFLANTRDDGTVEMSAASRIVSPANETRSAIVAVTALECRRKT